MISLHLRRSLRRSSALLSICVLLAISTVSSISDMPSHPLKQKLVVGVDGGTESIRACCFDAETGQVVGEAVASPYKTYHPNPGWAEQDPKDWNECMGKSVRGAIDSLDTQDYEI